MKLLNNYKKGVWLLEPTRKKFKCWRIRVCNWKNCWIGWRRKKVWGDRMENRNKINNLLFLSRINIS
jgi:hypothetical protein